MTSLAARAGTVLRNIARQGAYNLKPKEHKFALDMRYNLILGAYKRLRDFRNESDKMALA